MSIEILKSYVSRYDDLTPYEFEEMVGFWYKCKGWKNVSVSPRANDMGRDVIATDLDGNKWYIEVKQYSGNVGRPVIQKLHSIMEYDNIRYGCVVTTASFSKGAIDYAFTVNIDLVNGKQFIDSCQSLIRGCGVNDRECIKIFPHHIFSASKSEMKRHIFSYPNHLSIEYVKGSIIFEPDLYVKFSLYQKFTTNSKYKDVIYTINDNSVWFSIKRNMTYSSFPFVDTTSMDRLILEWQMKSEEKPKIKTNYSIDSIKKMIMNFKKKTVIYRGRNNIVYERECQPSMNNIQIYEYIPFFNIYTTFELLCNGKKYIYKHINGITTPNNYLKTFICHICSKDYYLDNIRICRNCGCVTCSSDKSCVKFKRFFLFFKRYWCINCYSLLEKREISRRKSDISRKIRHTYKKWKYGKKDA